MHEAAVRIVLLLMIDPPHPIFPTDPSGFLSTSPTSQGNSFFLASFPSIILDLPLFAFPQMHLSKRSDIEIETTVQAIIFNTL